ncbi:MAG: hypothetical protein ACOX9C_05395 [Kiritimatiellia bacterium]
MIDKKVGGIVKEVRALRKNYREKGSGPKATLRDKDLEPIELLATTHAAHELAVWAIESQEVNKKI